MKYKKFFNSTEISAVLEGFPAKMRGYIWFRNFYSPNENSMHLMLYQSRWF
jgi:hypothetical protein